MGCAVTPSRDNREHSIGRTPPTVGIVGGGYAGMAAAVALANRGIPVVVYEAARRLGGRARAVEHENALLDNGQHLLIGAYRDTLDLLDLVGTRQHGLLRVPLQWNVLPEFSFSAAGLPAPWHLAVGLLRARGVSLGARVGCARFLTWCRRNAFTLARDTTAAELLREQRQDARLVRFLWEPLCVAALNTPLALASAQVFLTVLRDGLAADRAASDLLFPRVDLSSLFPDPAARFVQVRGGEVRTSANVTTVRPSGGGYTLTTNQGETRHAAVILATQPYRIKAIAGHLEALADPIAQIDAMSYQPIITLYLRYAAAPSLAFPMTGLAQPLTQWVFDRAAISASAHAQSGLIAAVISTRGRQQELPHDELAARVHAEIAIAYPGLGPSIWSQVIEEKRATFACTPNLQRPDQATSVPGLFLAGDYTLSEYPATIEAAVRSGLRCAQLARNHLQSNGLLPSPTP